MTTSTTLSTYGALATRAASRTGWFLRRQLWVWPLLAAAVLAFVGLWVRAHLENTIRGEITNNLVNIRDANAEALRAWAKSMKSQAELLAGQEQTRSLIESAINRSTTSGLTHAALVAAPEFEALRAQLKPVEEGHGFAGYAVLNTNFVVIAAGQEQFVSLMSPPEYAQELSACLRGDSLVTPPFTALGLVPDHKGTLTPGLPLMFAAAPVHGSDGRVIAVLGLRILPHRDFTRILATARSGQSGETYAFNRDGVLLSESRFDDELKAMGLLADSPEARSLLALDLRDPLLDLREGRRMLKRRAELPFTEAVADALTGKDGVNVQGYRDYRGVPVVGAWRWLPDFQIGLVTEMDQSEALAPVWTVRHAFWLLFSLMVVGSIIVYLQMHLARFAALKATRLGQYALGEELGAGAFGTVFRAQHALMRRPVAVKVLSPFADDTAVVRFEREVQLTCQLTHPNTIALYDYGRTPDNLFYYAMEYLEGLSLAQLIKQYGPQPEGRVLHILGQACGSLAEAHARGLIHRDVKPHNIFLTRRGGIPDFVKVLDFGLVKACSTAGQLELTSAGATLGTPLYMSPEAVEGPAKVDALSDVYSLGAVGYELLTGQTVFCGTTIGEILLQQVRGVPEKPSVRLKRPVSADLEDLLMRCLAKKPSERPTAAALEEALGHCASSGTWTRYAAEQWWTNRFIPPASKAAA